MNPTDWVLVTGAAHRLGREIALAFAAAGWDVLCHYRASLAGAEGTQAAVRALGRECLLVPAGRWARRTSLLRCNNVPSAVLPRAKLGVPLFKPAEQNRCNAYQLSIISY